MREYQRVTFLDLAKLVYPGHWPWYWPERVKQISIKIEGIPEKGRVLHHYLGFELKRSKEFQHEPINGTIELFGSKRLELILERYIKNQEALIIRGMHSFRERYSLEEHWFSYIFIDELLPSKGEIGGVSISEQNLEGRLSLSEEQNES